MADLAGDLIDWLKKFKKDDLVWIDEGGLTLEGFSTKGRKKGQKPVYYGNEIGGEPREEDDAEEDIT
jgi:hypothetical protein